VTPGCYTDVAAGDGRDEHDVDRADHWTWSYGFRWRRIRRRRLRSARSIATLSRVLAEAAFLMDRDGLPPGLSISTGGRCPGPDFGWELRFDCHDRRPDEQVHLSGSATRSSSIPLPITTGGVLPQGITSTPYSQTLTEIGCGSGCTGHWRSGSLPLRNHVEFEWIAFRERLHRFITAGSWCSSRVERHDAKGIVATHQPIRFSRCLSV